MLSRCDECDGGGLGPGAGAGRLCHRTRTGRGGHHAGAGQSSYICLQCRLCFDWSGGRHWTGRAGNQQVSSLSKMLQVLTLFNASEPLLTADEIMQRLDYTRPTTYRYIRELCAAGLLGRFANGYALGPRVIELDYIIRQADPVLKVARGRMR